MPHSDVFPGNGGKSPQAAPRGRSALLRPPDKRSPPGERFLIMEDAVKRTVTIILILLWLLPLGVRAETPPTGEWTEGIFRWREARGGAFPPDQAGTAPFDWYAFDAALLGRGGTGDYLSALQQAPEGRLATDEHRKALALTALGADPAALIRRGVTHRQELGRQGSSAYIWSLILLDARQTPLPPDSLYTREGLVSSLLAYQTEAGGFSLEGRIPDADMTAMALCALYPYRESCREQTDRAWAWLSRTQLDTGGFQSWGNVNCESTAQVLIALCVWGRDPLTDGDFIKEGRTLFDALAAYRREDGGFAHTPAGDSNPVASEQVLRACVAYTRMRQGRGLYDLTDRPAPPTVPTTAVTTGAVTTAATASTAVTDPPTTAATATTATSTAAGTTVTSTTAAASATATTTAAVPSGAPAPAPAEGISPLWLILPGAAILSAGLFLWRRRK